MATITTRSGKGSPLTNAEVDDNFTNLNTDKAELSGAAFTGAITTTSTIDGRDVAADGTKLDGIEAGADVTDTANVTAAGALMDSEVTNLAQVKAFDSADYATAAQGSTADSAMQDLVDDTTPQLGGDLASNGNDILFADNDKAIFGGSQDLQIYHDGSHSYVQDTNAGNLYLKSNGAEITLRDGSNTSMIRAFTGGAVRLFNNGTERLETTSTGIDVTGEVEGDSLKIGTNTDGASIEITSAVTDFTIGGLSTGSDLLFSYNRGNGDTTIANGTRGSETTRAQIDNGGDISFYDSAGTSQDLYWDASTSRLGLGTTTPQHEIHISSASPNIRFNDSDSTSVFGDVGFDGGNLVLDSRNGANNGKILFRGAGGGVADEYARFDSVGRLGLGTTSPSTLMHLSASSPRITLTDTDTGADHRINADSSAGNLSLDLDVNSETTSPSFVVNMKGDEKFRITNSGNIQLPIGNDQTIGQVFSTAHSSGNVGSIGLTISDGGGHSGVFVNNTHDGTYSDQSITFKTAEGGVSSATERVRIDSSGNVVIGDSTAKTRLQSSGAGAANAPSLGSVSSNAPLYLTNNDVAYGLVAGTNASDGHAWLQAQRTDGTATAYNITLNEAGGNVGIGTDSPAEKLDIEAGNIRLDNNQHYYLRTANDGANAGSLSADASNRVILYSQYNALRLESRGSYEMQFYTDATERMRIDSSGKVGIGTSAVGSADGSLLTIGNSSSASYTQYSVGASGGGAVGSEGNGLVFYGYSGNLGSESYTKHMTIDSSGNVGIANSSPATKLDVAGVVTHDGLRNSNTTTTSSSKTLADGEFCTVTASGRTITLPASPAAGDQVSISVGNFTDTIVGRNSQNIMGLAENMTIDVANMGVTLVYSGNSTQGWRLL